MSPADDADDSSVPDEGPRLHRVAVFGERAWPDRGFVWEVLDEVRADHPTLYVITDTCYFGVSLHAQLWCWAHGVPYKRVRGFAFPKGGIPMLCNTHILAQANRVLLFLNSPKSRIARIVKDLPSPRRKALSKAEIFYLHKRQWVAYSAQNKRRQRR